MTEDDANLSRIGKHVREDQQDDAALERLARGERAASSSLEAGAHDAELAAIVAAAQPLDPAVVDRIAASLGPAPARPAATRADATAAEGAPPSAPVPAATARSPRRLGLVRRIGPYVGPLALAAAVLLYFVGRGSSGPEAPRLPVYAVSATGEQAMRGAEPAPAGEARLRVGAPNGRFEIVARPASSVEGKVVGYPFAIVDGEPSPLDGKVEVAPTGVVRITGASRGLRGATEVRLVVGAPEAIGKFDDATARAKSGQGDAHVVVLRVPVEPR